MKRRAGKHQRAAAAHRLAAPPVVQLVLLVLGILATVRVGHAQVAAADANTALEATGPRVTSDSLKARLSELQAELAALQRSTSAYKTTLEQRAKQLAEAREFNRRANEEAKTLESVSLSELNSMPGQIVELDEALKAIDEALAGIRRSERLRLRLKPDAVIPAERALNSQAESVTKEDLGPLNALQPVQDVCKEVYVGGRNNSGGWYLPEGYIKARQGNAIIVSSGIAYDHTDDEHLQKALASVNNETSQVQLYISDPDPSVQEWGSKFQVSLHAPNILKDLIIGGQSRRTSYGLLYGDAAMPMNTAVQAMADKELRVLSLIAFSRMIKVNHFHVVKLHVPPSLHHWARLIRNVDKMTVDILLVHFLPGPVEAPPPSLEALVDGSINKAPITALEDLVWKIATESQWRIYHVDPQTRRRFTFVRVCGQGDEPCSCCRKLVPIFCSLQPPRTSV